MAEMSIETLCELKKLIPAIRALKKDLERSIYMEFYSGTGDLAVKSYQGLHAKLAEVTDDSYVKTISLSVPENATDKEKAALVLLAAGQFLAYLEGQTAQVSIDRKDTKHISTREIRKFMDVATKLLKDKEKKKEEDKTEQ